MSYIVGPKGQVVIAKEFRDKLAVKSGWTALQRLVEDHVEIYFLPPPHRKSLKGSLSKYTNISISPGEEWEKAREVAWNKAAHDSELERTAGEPPS
ncbi:MAG: AbrB family transcriptional regulator [Dehalococcoidia bacterium]|nr:AbrB family transcriptional regulator [Dehalococcoidia bacterium]